MAKFKNVCGEVIEMTPQEETEFNNFQAQATKDFNDFMSFTAIWVISSGMFARLYILYFACFAKPTNGRSYLILLALLNHSTSSLRLTKIKSSDLSKTKKCASPCIHPGFPREFLNSIQSLSSNFFLFLFFLRSILIQTFLPNEDLPVRI